MISITLLVSIYFSNLENTTKHNDYTKKYSTFQHFPSTLFKSYFISKIERAKTKFDLLLWSNGHIFWGIKKSNRGRDTNCDEGSIIKLCSLTNINSKI